MFLHAHFTKCFVSAALEFPSKGEIFSMERKPSESPDIDERTDDCSSTPDT